MNSTSDIRAPTSAELLSLAALTNSPAPPANMHDLLGDVTRYIRTPQILDFLFSSQPLHLAPLLSDTLTDSAFVFHTGITRVEAPPPVFPTPSYTDAGSQHISSSVLLAPAQTLPGLCVLGVGIMHSVHLQGRHVLPLSMQKSQACTLDFRFLFDPVRRSTLMVFDSAVDDSIAMYFATNASLTALHTTTASFARSRLLELIRTHSDALTADHLSSALVCLFRDYKERMCPLCYAAPWTRTCQCVVPLVRPQHAADLSFFKANQMAYFGAYEGISERTVMLPSGAHRVTLGARFTMRDVHDKRLMERMREWSIRTYFQDIADNPLESVVFPRSPAPDVGRVEGEWEDDVRVSAGYAAGSWDAVPGPLEIGHGGVERVVSTVGAGAVDGAANARVADPMTAQLEELLAKMGDGGATAVGADEEEGVGVGVGMEMRMMPGVRADAAGWEMGGALEEGALTVFQGYGRRGSGTGTGTTKRVRGDSTRGARRGRVESGGGMGRGRNANGGGGMWRSGVGEAYARGPAGGQLPYEAGDVGADAGRGVGVDVGSVGGGQAGIGSGGAPATATATATASTGEVRSRDRGGKAGEDVHEILRRIKDQERRERNRISARRSNRKKKERGLALEREVGRMRALKAELQAREGRLREENWELRDRVQARDRLQGRGMGERM